jgi:hypothetical protein
VLIKYSVFKRQNSLIVVKDRTTTLGPVFRNLTINSYTQGVYSIEIISKELNECVKQAIVFPLNSYVS